MSEMKKKKGANDPPVNKNRSDTKNSKTPIVTDNKAAASKGKGKK
jgi:hypothetical protein